MSQFVQTLKEVFEKQERPEGRLDTTELIVNRIEFQKLQPATKLFLQEYSALTRLTIVHCDMRTLENFPMLPQLKELCLANNRLQGTVEHLVRLGHLEYLDLSNNLIKEVTRLSPLKRIKNLAVYLAGNPFLKCEGWKLLLDSFRFTVEKQARDFNEAKFKQQPPSAEKEQEEPLNICRDSTLRNLELGRRMPIRRYRNNIEEDVALEVLLRRRLDQRYEREMTNARVVPRQRPSIQQVLNTIQGFSRRRTQNTDPPLIQRFQSEESDKIPDSPLESLDPQLAFGIVQDEDEDEQPSNLLPQYEQGEEESFASSPSNAEL